jgi:hypothetical protein
VVAEKEEEKISVVNAVKKMKAEVKVEVAKIPKRGVKKEKTPVKTAPRKQAGNKKGGKKNGDGSDDGEESAYSEKASSE